MRFSPTQLLGAAAVVLGLTVAGEALRAHDHAALSAALSDAHTARLALQTQAARAAHADSVAASAELGARAAALRENVASAHADSATRTLATMRERYRVVTVTVPDTCLSIKAAADSALAASDSVAASEHAARRAADDRAAFLQVGLDTTRDALTKLRGAAVVSAFATARLEHDAKPPFLSRFLKAVAPRVGVGFTAGLDVHGVPNAVTGITVGWSF